MLFVRGKVLLTVGFVLSPTVFLLIEMLLLLLLVMIGVRVDWVGCAGGGLAVDCSLSGVWSRLDDSDGADVPPESVCTEEPDEVGGRTGLLVREVTERFAPF